MMYFYKYEVEWFNEGQCTKERGITIGENYTEASSNVAQVYGDDQIGYIHLICLSEDSVAPVLFEEEFINYFKNEEKNYEK